jgi:2-oxoglutarate/2-oxoacid ferredoxin oxidoreductase subunit beta
MTELQPNPIISRYLRPGHGRPDYFCPGCGIGIVMGALIRAIHASNLHKDEVFIVSGAGCSGFIPLYLDFTSINAPQGSALAIAIGVKLAHPHYKVIVITGDGDLAGTGGNHFIHACRRNIGLTVLAVNNRMYARTGGQPSPTTPTGEVSSFSPYGTIEQPFDLCELAAGCGANFAARQTAFHAEALSKLIEDAIKQHGFSIVEAVMKCVIFPERISPVEALKSLRDEVAVKGNKKDKHKIMTGILHRSAKPEFTEEYEKNIAKNRN